ncbi:MAG: hypothetical protein M3Y58_03730, partial [Chloroflexota bacterium]|nr:hypothetical protein [Chloroflexota bacterium]
MRRAISRPRRTWSRLAALHRAIPCSEERGEGERDGHRLTQRGTHYVHARTDDADRPAFAGLRYVSRHGAARECWALFAWIGSL